MKHVTLVLLVSAVACQSPDRIGVTTVEHIEVSTPSYNPDETGHLALEINNDFKPCPENTVIIDGEYCPKVRQTCKTWVSLKGEAIPEAKPKDGESGRCGTFNFPTICLVPKVHVRYCIDKFEYPNVEGMKPQTWMDYWEVKAACENRGERICEKSEWTFACEGEEMHPLPYGDGYHRNSTDCNLDNRIPKGVYSTLDVKGPTSPEGILLDGLLNFAGNKSKCVSPFGVFDMVGNADEFVHDPNGHVGVADPKDRGPFTSALVGGHVFGVRNACRPLTAGHDEHFRMFETGGRCCVSPRY